MKLTSHYISIVLCIIGLLWIPKTVLLIYLTILSIVVVSNLLNLDDPAAYVKPNVEPVPDELYPNEIKPVSRLVVVK